MRRHEPEPDSFLPTRRSLLSRNAGGPVLWRQASSRIRDHACRLVGLAMDRLDFSYERGHATSTS
jgi:hypothetical protein